MAREAKMRVQEGQGGRTGVGGKLELTSKNGLDGVLRDVESIKVNQRQLGSLGYAWLALLALPRQVC